METLSKIFSARPFGCSLFWAVIVYVTCIMVLPNPAHTQTVDTVFSENWELGIGSWWADNGVWEVGRPTVGPSNVHSGQNCAGTILGGTYPWGANTRIISPWIHLPNASEGKKIQLKFWHWFWINIHAQHKGFVQIKAGSGDWENVGGSYGEYSRLWTQAAVDISPYAGETIRIAFYFESNYSGYQGDGWYVDDISITQGPLTINNPEGFEEGIGEWGAENGLWEVGKPTVGPSSAHSGQNCAATVLGGDYPRSASTRFISPELTIDTSGSVNPELFFWHWFRISPGDAGYVQIKVASGEWVNVGGPFLGESPVWSQYYVDLSPYIGRTVRIAFYFVSDVSGGTNGWYIDDIRFPIFNHPPLIRHTIPDTTFAEDAGPHTMVTNLDSNFSDREGDLIYTVYSDNINIQATIQGKSVIVNSSKDYFGSGNVRITATDNGGKSVSDTFMVVISPVNDAPRIDLLGSITFRNDSSVVIRLWEFASDVETAASLLTYQCRADSAWLLVSYNPVSGAVTLSAPGSGGSCRLFVSVTDDSNATANDTVRVAVVQLPAPVSLVSPHHGATVGTDSVRAVWRQCQPAVNLYWFERATDSLFTTPIIDASLTDTTKVIRGMANNYVCWWRVRARNDAGWGPFSEARRFRVVITGVDEAQGLPREFSLSQNYPNPFNPSTTITFAVPKSGFVELKVYDILGREVATLVNERLEPGWHTATWDAAGFASGVYLYRMKAGSSVETKKLLFMR